MGRPDSPGASRAASAAPGAPISTTAFWRAGSIPWTSAYEGVLRASFMIIAGVYTTGATATTPGIAAARAATASASGKLGAPASRICRSPLPRRIRSFMSCSKPVIRASAMTSAAVPTATPATEMIVMTERNVRPRCTRR